MKTLQLKNTQKISLTNGTTHDLGKLTFDASQFKIPTKFVILKDEVEIKVDKEKNSLGELVETGTYTITFKAYDRALVELAMQNELTEYGSPINVLLENADTLPILDQFTEIDFIPIKFEDLTIKPRKVERKVYVNGQSTGSWQYADLKVTTTAYALKD
jgi:hypothetical protein